MVPFTGWPLISLWNAYMPTGFSAFVVTVVVTVRDALPLEEDEDVEVDEVVVVVGTVSTPRDEVAHAAVPRSRTREMRCMGMRSDLRGKFRDLHPRTAATVARGIWKNEGLGEALHSDQG